ncbi:MAG: hypothetical protein ACM31C_16650 [Acidobacteriota bacterium]
MRAAVLALLVGGCTTTVGHLSDGPCAVENVTGSLPGVTLAIRSSSCRYSQGAMAHFTYEVTTDSTVPAITTPGATGGGCGSCFAPGPDPLSFVDWSIGGTAPDGTSQSYCLCDTGCCPPDRMYTVQPAVADETDTIDWDTHNWGGPSDYNAPQGPVFPAGVYGVYVTFIGFSSGRVTAVLPIEIDD